MKKNELSKLVAEFEGLSEIIDVSERLHATKKLRKKLLNFIISPNIDADDKEVFIQILEKLALN